MAYTTLVDVTLGGAGNAGDTPTYDPIDMANVASQLSYHHIESRNVIFRGDELTVRAGVTLSGSLLNKLALPCPPWGPPRKGSEGGNYLPG